nr:hypothetical protein [Candidatus Baldrarchaeota archaeon]
MKTIQLTTSDENLQFKAIKKILQILSEKSSENATPVWISNEILQEISKITRNPDFFEKLKKVITSHSK